MAGPVPRAFLRLRVMWGGPWGRGGVRSAVVAEVAEVAGYLVDEGQVEVSGGRRPVAGVGPPR